MRVAPCCPWLGWNPVPGQASPCAAAEEPAEGQPGDGPSRGGRGSQLESGWSYEKQLSGGRAVQISHRWPGSVGATAQEKQSCLVANLCVSAGRALGQCPGAQALQAASGLRVELDSSSKSKPLARWAGIPTAFTPRGGLHSPAPLGDRALLPALPLCPVAGGSSPCGIQGHGLHTPSHVSHSCLHVFCWSGIPATRVSPCQRLPCWQHQHQPLAYPAFRERRGKAQEAGSSRPQ